MYGLPQSTEVSRQLPKTTIYKKFNVSSKDQALIDRDISRLDNVNEISGRTTAINPGENIQSIFVVKVQLKRMDYDPASITKLMDMIGQKCIFGLSFLGEVSFACKYIKLFTSNFLKENEAKLVLEGLNLDVVWENMLAGIIGLSHIEETGLDFQVQRKIKLNEMYKNLEKLKKNEKKEIQPRKKHELHSMVIKLKKEIEELESNPRKI